MKKIMHVVRKEPALAILAVGETCLITAGTMALIHGNVTSATTLITPAVAGVLTARRWISGKNRK